MPSNNAGTIGYAIASPKSTRRVPHCRQCKRPRAGHPRSGCPYVNNANNVALTRDTTGDPSDRIADALGSLHITPPVEESVADQGDIAEDESSRATPKTNNARDHAVTAPRHSLHSLSTSAGEIFERLKRQEDLYNPERRHSKVTRIAEWRSAVAAALTSENLNDTSDYNITRSFQPTQENTTSRDGGSNRTRALSHSIHSPNSSILATHQVTRASTNRPLVRSMSMEEREAFVKSLSQASDATVYVLPKADIFEVQAEATKIGFRTRVVMKDESDDLQALLVLAREEEAVEWLFRKIEKEDREATLARRRGQHSGRSISISALAGGAVIGAVGAWAGLAFA
ncbi:hypothetical protein M378DRAFT_7220 [Amanita muscaria Koide BX008]|uniref:Uncharacterized protein n=1 Tax=Amanita muscaria (strain Koide BX008) TaxID=946122 RepID=A0A0C2T3A4_AMAMK|nr:hypothetical protein M378DRAFT_7220 [Amanita muscaria Koide BX008]